MRNLKKALALLLVLAMALSLAACGKKDNDNQNPGNNDNPSVNNPGNNDADPSGDPGRVLNVAASQDTGTLYPFAVSGGFVGLMYVFYQQLWVYDAEGNKQMILAKDWEVISDTEYKLTIRDDVTFANGNKLTAEDVLFSMQLCAEDPRFYLNVKVVDMEKTKVTGDYTMDVFYTSYDCTQETSFADLHIVDKESFDIEALSTRPNGTGPYVVEDYVVNSHIKCVARDDYWGEAPKIKQINFRVINEQAQIINALETGEIDIATAIPVAELDYVKDLGYDVMQTYSGYTNVALFSFAGPLASKEARYAVSHAMDRAAIAQVMYGEYGSVPSYPTSEHTTDYEERFANMHETYSVGYNVDKAKEYAEAAGLVGKTLRIVTNGSEDFNNAAVVLQNNLKAIGVESSITPLDNATYFGKLNDIESYDIALFYYNSPCLLGVDIIGNYMDFVPLGWTGPERDEFGTISKQAVHTMDPAERADLLYDALKIFVDFDPWYSLCEVVGFRAHSPELGGIAYTLSGVIRYDQLFFK